MIQKLVSFFVQWSLHEQCWQFWFDWHRFQVRLQCSLQDQHQRNLHYWQIHQIWRRQQVVGWRQWYHRWLHWWQCIDGLFLDHKSFLHGLQLLDQECDYPQEGQGHSHLQIQYHCWHPPWFHLQKHHTFASWDTKIWQWQCHLLQNSTSGISCVEEEWRSWWLRRSVQEQPSNGMWRVFLDKCIQSTIHDLEDHWPSQCSHSLTRQQLDSVFWLQYLCPWIQQQVACGQYHYIQWHSSHHLWYIGHFAQYQDLAWLCCMEFYHHQRLWPWPLVHDSIQDPSFCLLPIGMNCQVWLLKALLSLWLIHLCLWWVLFFWHHMGNQHNQRD